MITNICIWLYSLQSAFSYITSFSRVEMFNDPSLQLRFINSVHIRSINKHIQKKLSSRPLCAGPEQKADREMSKPSIGPVNQTNIK